MYYGSPDVPQQKIDYIYKTFELLESVLQDSPYLVGDNLTLADLSCISTVASLCGPFPPQPEKYPKLNEWINRLEQLPYYAEVNQKGADILTKLYLDKVAENQAAAKK